MFSPEDYKLSMEKELTFVNTQKAIEGCEDINQLREMLIILSKQYAINQQLLTKAICNQILEDIKKIQRKEE